MGDISDLRILYEIKNDIDMYIKYIDDEKTFKKYIPDGDPNLSFIDQFIEKNKSLTDEAINTQINNLSIIYNDSSSQSSESDAGGFLPSSISGSIRSSPARSAATSPATSQATSPARSAAISPATSSASSQTSAATSSASSQTSAASSDPSTVQFMSDSESSRSVHSDLPSNITTISDPLDRSIALLEKIEEDDLKEEASLNKTQVEKDKQEFIDEVIHEFTGAQEMTLDNLMQNPPYNLEKDFDNENANESLIDIVIPQAWQNPSTRRPGKNINPYMQNITQKNYAAGLPSSPFPASHQTNFHGPHPFRQRGGAKISDVQIKKKQIDTILQSKANKIKLVSKKLKEIKSKIKIKSPLQIQRNIVERGQRTDNEIERIKYLASAIPGGFQYLAEMTETYVKANDKIKQNDTFIRETREGKQRSNYDQNKWAVQCKWINGKIDENSRCFLCGLPFGIAAEGIGNRTKLTNFHNYPNLKTVSKYTKESGEHIYTSIAGFGLIGYPNSANDVNIENRSFWARSLEWCHFWCNQIKNELFFITLSKQTKILQVRTTNIEWMIKSLVWGTGTDQKKRFFDSELVQTVLCKGQQKFVYPTFILAFIDGIYKQPPESFEAAANRFILDRIQKLTQRVSSTVNFLNTLNSEVYLRQRTSLVEKYQDRLINPGKYINNIRFPTQEILSINARQIFNPVINTQIPSSPECGFSQSLPIGILPNFISRFLQKTSNLFTFHRRQTRAKKYKSRKTRKVRK
jgi:hypothetical protein